MPVLAVVVALLVVTPVLAGSGTSALARRLGLALRGPGLDPSRTGAIVVDLTTGRTVFAQNADRPLVPASNEKLPLTYAALLDLGPGFRIPTEVRGEGRLVGRTWRGNLVLKGYGDPMLSTSDLQRLVRRVRAFGIRRVTGSIVGDESYFDRNRLGAGWKWSFYLNECPALSALVANRGETPHGPARLPALAAAVLFRRLLRAAGVQVAGSVKAVTAGGQPLAYVLSPPLATILRGMDRRSDNFRAEELLKLLGAEMDGRGSSAAGAAVVRRTLQEQGLPLQGLRLADGSGLSSLDRITPRTIAAILVAAWRNVSLRPYVVGALAVPGRDGTLQDRFLQRGVRGAVRAKTGTTDLASALSGLVRDRFVFSILQNGFPVSYWSAHTAQDRFVGLLAAQ